MGLSLLAVRGGPHRYLGQAEEREGFPGNKAPLCDAGFAPTHWVTVHPSNGKSVTTSPVPAAPGPLGLGIWQPGGLHSENKSTVLHSLTDALYRKHKGTK